jgi:hypothetical protein
VLATLNKETRTAFAAWAFSFQKFASWQNRRLQTPSGLH